MIGLGGLLSRDEERLRFVEITYMAVVVLGVIDGVPSLVKISGEFRFILRAINL